MTQTIDAERRERPRGRVHLLMGAVYRGLRTLIVHANNFYAAVGIFLIAGVAIALAGTWAFALLASSMSAGATQQFDDAVLRWMAEHQRPWIERLLLEITMMGNSAPVIATVVIAGLFLWLTRHRYSALLLLAATIGGQILSALLKHVYERPRPSVFDWGQHVATYSFPSGHAMGSTIVYATVAYLAARLQRHRIARAATLTIAAAVIVLISLSRMYLGVHYPSDVLAGVVIGLAWAAFCMATLEALQVLSRRSTPEVREEVLEHEEPAPSTVETT